MLTACQFKRPIYLCNKIFHGKVVTISYFPHPSPRLFNTGGGTNILNTYLNYFFMVHKKTLGTVGHDHIKDELLTSSNL